VGNHRHKKHKTVRGTKNQKRPSASYYYKVLGKPVGYKISYRPRKGGKMIKFFLQLRKNGSPYWKALTRLPKKTKKEKKGGGGSRDRGASPGPRRREGEIREREIRERRDRARDDRDLSDMTMNEAIGEWLDEWRVLNRKGAEQLISSCEEEGKKNGLGQSPKSVEECIRYLNLGGERGDLIDEFYTWLKEERNVVYNDKAECMYDDDGPGATIRRLAALGRDDGAQPLTLEEQAAALGVRGDICASCSEDELRLLIEEAKEKEYLENWRIHNPFTWIRRAGGGQKKKSPRLTKKSRKGRKGGGK